MLLRIDPAARQAAYTTYTRVSRCDALTNLNDGVTAVNAISGHTAANTHLCADTQVRPMPDGTVTTEPA